MTDRLILRELVEHDWGAVHAIESQGIMIVARECDSLIYAILDREWA